MLEALQQPRQEERELWREIKRSCNRLSPRNDRFSIAAEALSSCFFCQFNTWLKAAGQLPFVCKETGRRHPQKKKKWESIHYEQQSSRFGLSSTLWLIFIFLFLPVIFFCLNTSPHILTALFFSHHIMLFCSSNPQRTLVLPYIHFFNHRSASSQPHSCPLSFVPISMKAKIFLLWFFSHYLTTKWQHWFCDYTFLKKHFDQKRKPWNCWKWFSTSTQMCTVLCCQCLLHCTHRCVCVLSINR